MKCDICGKKFKRSGLHDHQRVHEVHMRQLTAEDDTIKMSVVHETVDQVLGNIVPEIGTTFGMEGV